MQKNLIFLLFLLLIIITCECRGGGQQMINGIPSEIQPFMVSIRNARMDFPFGVGHLCGGAILSSRAILTAASCFQRQNQIPTEDLQVIANTNLRYEMRNFVATQAIEVISHPDFSAADRWDNIAIVVVDPELPIGTRNMEAINLTRDSAVPGDPCEIFGFGQAMSLNGPEQMLRGNVTVLDNSACRDARENMICAGEKTYPCNGDEGGPIICDNQIAGIIDFFDFSQCRLPDQARFVSYVDVAPYRRWIAEQISRIESTVFIESTSSAEKLKKSIFSRIVLMIFVLKCLF